MNLITSRRRTRYARYLIGKGLEIGALQNPMPLPRATSVLYSDVLTGEQIDAIYPGGRHPDIVSDSEHYPDVADGSFDFIVANHVLEHLTDPIGALIEWHRILAPSGLLLLSVPDKRYTFDYSRRRTTLEHLWSDHRSHAPVAELNLCHLHEWAEHVERLKPGTPAYDEWINEQVGHGFTVHNHVWVLGDILALIRSLSRAGTHYALRKWDDASVLGNEFTLLLQKSSAPEKTGSTRLTAAAIATALTVPMHAVASRLRRAFRLRRHIH